MQKLKSVFVFLIFFCHIAICNAAPQTHGKSEYRLCNNAPNDTEGTLLDFFYSPAATPNGECLYLLSANHIPLTASQVTPKGVLVGATWSQLNRFVFLYNDNKIDANLVDGAIIQPGYFVYVGNFSYVSITGPRSVYAFRRIENPFAEKDTNETKTLANSETVLDSRPLTLDGDHVVKGGQFLGAYAECIAGPAGAQYHPTFIDWLGNSHEDGRIEISSFKEKSNGKEVEVGKTFLYLWTICRAPLTAFVEECRSRKYQASQCYAALTKHTNEFIQAALTYPPRVNADPSEYIAVRGSKKYTVIKNICGRKDNDKSTYTTCTEQPTTQKPDSYIHCQEAVITQMKRDMSLPEEIERRKKDPTYSTVYSCKSG